MSLKTEKKITLKTVADRVGLAPCSVSAVLNDTPASRAIPPTTKEKIFRAAAELNYRPNFWARSLRIKRTRMIAAVTSDFGRPAVARIIAVAQLTLACSGYVFVLASINSIQNLQLPERGIEGLIAVDVAVPPNIDLPIVGVRLDYLKSPELIGTGVQLWLSDLGVSAAQAIIQQIETAHSNAGSKQSEHASKLLKEQFSPLTPVSVASSNDAPAKLWKTHTSVQESAD